MTTPNAPRPTDYEVGYGKPPKSGQIQKGEVRSPGRAGKNGVKKKKALGDHIAELWQKMADEKVTVTIDGRPQKMFKIELVLYRMMADAIAGSAAARREIRQWQREFPQLLERINPLPNGKIILAFAPPDAGAIQKLTTEQIVEAFPDMPDEDLQVIERYWTMPEGKTLSRRDIYMGMHPDEQSRLFDKFGLK
jgi:hypothetical protein